MRKREILQPDFLFDDATGATIADLKTISFTRTNYGGQKRTVPHLAVDTRAKRVHKDYVKKAQAADRKWNNTPEDSVGPIESRLNEFFSPSGSVARMQDSAANTSPLEIAISMARRKHTSAFACRN